MRERYLYLVCKMSSPSISGESNGVSAVPMALPGSGSSNIDNTSTISLVENINVDMLMEETSDSATSLNDRQVQASDSLLKMQDTINRLTIQLTIIAARLSAPVAGDNLEKFQAEYHQKDNLLKAIISTKMSIEKSNAESFKNKNAMVDPTCVLVTYRTFSGLVQFMNLVLISLQMLLLVSLVFKT
jgi:hypothetical protein